eukprot:1142286-Pelagomonas_calceolata.AAC.3
MWEGLRQSKLIHICETWRSTWVAHASGRGGTSPPQVLGLGTGSCQHGYLRVHCQLQMLTCKGLGAFWLQVNLRGNWLKLT